MSCSLRTATAFDAPAIAGVHVASWRAAYSHILPASFFESLSVQRRTEAWVDVLSALPPGETCHVAEVDGLLVGFCHTGPSRDDDAGGAGEVFAIYVTPEHWNAGAGQALFRQAQEILAGAGHGEATLWVLEQNDRGRAFYERNGWYPDGATKTYESGTRALRYRAGLSSNSRVPTTR